MLDQLQWSTQKPVGTFVISMGRFRVKLRETFDPTLLPHVEEVFQSESLLQAVVHGHLLLERALTTLIRQKMSRPEVLENGFFGRWSFHQKLGLYVGLYDPPEEQWKMLKGFNELRNALAHRLDDAEVWVSKCLPWQELTSAPTPRSHVWTITAKLFFELGILQGIENLDASSSSGDDSATSQLVQSSWKGRYARSAGLDALCRLTGRIKRVCGCERCHAERSKEIEVRAGVTEDDRSKSVDFLEPRLYHDRYFEIHFLHPRDSGKSLIADVSPECSAEDALASLTDGGDGAFLPVPAAGQTYELVVHRTMRLIRPEMTFEQAGVIDGDWIDIQLSGCLGI